MCYVTCQNILVNVFVHLLEHLRFGLRWLSFLLLKFPSQLKLIQSVVRVGILGICVTSSIFRVLLSGFWASGSQVPSLRDPVPESRVSGCRAPGSQSPGPGSQCPGSQVSWFQGPGLQCPKVPWSRLSKSQVSGLRVLGPGSQVLILDYAEMNIMTKSWEISYKNVLIYGRYTNWSHFWNFRLMTIYKIYITYNALK